MLTIIESESNTWTIVVVDDDLRIYTREEPGQWRGLTLSDSDSIDQERSLMLEELYLQRSEESEDGTEDDSDDPEDFDEEDSEPTDVEDSEEEEEEGEGEAEEAEKPSPRRSRTPANRGGGSRSRK
ncbi:MAG TPA: hypothetical protein VFW09_16105 [Solirubrobacteraceae bacterium]|nr:hypothetical protein [Solirubrobacteraceae bacterium]